jgi:hypothetical protein
MSLLSPGEKQPVRRDAYLQKGAAQLRLRLLLASTHLFPFTPAGRRARCLSGTTAWQPMRTGEEESFLRPC